MLNWIRITLISITALALMPAAQARDVEAAAGGDICESRPDLCGDAPVAQKKKKSKKKESETKAAKKKKCRQPDAPYSLESVDLPICGSDASMAAELVEEDLAAIEPELKKKRMRARTGKKNEPENQPVSFDSYLQTNASHPAISRRPNLTHQNAFQPVRRPAAITGSTVGASGGASSGTSPQPTSGSVADVDSSAAAGQ